MELKHPLRTLVVVIVAIVAFALGPAGVVKAQKTEGYIELFGDDGPFQFQLNYIAENITYSDKEPTWIYRGDGDFPTGVQIYRAYEDGEFPGTGYASTSTYRMSELKFKSKGLDSKTVSYGLWWDPDSDSGLVDTSHGMDVWIKLRIQDDPDLWDMVFIDENGYIAGLRLQWNDPYMTAYRVVQTGASTISARTLIGNMVDDSPYIFKISFREKTPDTWTVGSTAYGNIGQTVTSDGGVAGICDISDATKFQMVINEESGVQSRVYVDWVYVTSGAESTTSDDNNAGQEDRADQKDSYQSLGTTYTEPFVQYSNAAMGITNDSSSAAAQALFGHDRQWSSMTESYRNVGLGNFLGAWSVTPENLQYGSNTFTQALYTTIIENPRQLYETNLAAWLQQTQGLAYDPYVVDYEVKDAYGNIFMQNALLDQIQQFWLQAVPQIVTANGGTATLMNGNILSPGDGTTGKGTTAAMVAPDPTLTSSIERVDFPDQESYQNALQEMTYQARGSVLGNMVFFTGMGHNDFTSGGSGPNTAMFSTETSPFQGGTMVQAGIFSNAYNWAKKKATGGASTVTNGASSVANTVTGTATATANKVTDFATTAVSYPLAYATGQGQLTMEEQEEAMPEMVQEQGFTYDDVEYLTSDPAPLPPPGYGVMNTGLGGMLPAALNPATGKPGETPVGIAALIPTIMTFGAVALVITIGLFAVTAIALYFLFFTDRGRTFKDSMVASMKGLVSGR